MRKTEGLASITCREREILQWISQGKTNPEIAIILGISRHTVKKHVENLLGKFGAGNRIVLATRFLSNS